MSLRVAIIGAGPAGLTLAIALTKYHPHIHVSIFDRADDHSLAPTFNPSRSYTIDITGHGAKALRYINATDRFDRELIKFKGMKLQFVPGNAKDEYHGDAWTGSRGDICRCLQDEFVARKSPESTLTFNTAVEVINPELGEIRLTNPDGTTSEAQFDLVVASDGAGSAARRQMQASSSSFTVESMDNGNHSMMLAFDQNTDGLDPSYLYVFSPPPVMTVAGAINGVSGKSTPKWFCQVGFPGAKSFATVDEAKALLKSTLPPFTSFWKYASDAAIADFATQVCIATGKAKTCSSFHLGRTALLGDAGVPFPPIGQGVNAAMEMATVLEQTLTAHLQSQDWDAAAIPDALAAFTIKWKPEADAIRTISFEGLNLAER
ncbi:hypothetical protein As57867_006020, partial [Aphanomyces stellatus]